MASVLDAFVRFLADTRDVDDALNRRIPQQAGLAGDKAGTTMAGKFGGRVGPALGNAFAGIGAAAGFALVGATESAVKLEDQLRTIQTVAPDLNLDQAKQDIQALAAETGRTTDDLAAGFYDLVSAGVSAEDAIGVLRDSAKFATGALGSTAESVDLVTTVMNAYGLEAKDSARITDVFAKAVADGKVTAAGLGQSISTVAPLAAQMGISMEEVSAGAAAMTAQGFSAGETFTNMRQALSALLTPNETLNKIQKRTGQNFAAIAKERGAAAALEELRKAVNGNNEEFGKALGSTQALSFALVTTGENYEAFEQQIVDTTNSAGLATDQYNIKSQSMAEQGKRLAAQFVNVAQDVGGVVAPFAHVLLIANQLGPAFGGIISPARLVGTAIGGLFGKILPRLGGLGQKIGAKIGVGIATEIASQTTMNLLGDGITQAAGSSGPLAAARKGGGLLGAAMGAGLGAAALAAVLIVGKQIDDQIQSQIDAQKKQLNEFLTVATVNDLKSAESAIQAQLENMKILGIPWTAFGAREALEDELASIQARIAEAEGMEAAGATIPKNVGDGVRSTVGAVGGAVASIMEEAGAAVGAGAEEAGEIARRTPQEIADGITAARDKPRNAMQQLIELMKNPLKPGEEAARISGQLVSGRLAEGMRSRDPAVRAQAEATREILLDRLRQISPTSEAIGKKGMDLLRDALKSGSPAIRQAAQDVFELIDNRGATTVDRARTTGSQIPSAVAQGIRSTIGNVVGAVNDVIAQINRISNVRPQANVNVPQHHSGTDYVPRTGLALLEKGEIVVDRHTSEAIRAGQQVLGPGANPIEASPSGGNTYVVHVDGLVAARDRFEIANEMQRLSELGEIAEKIREPSVA